MDLSCQVSYHDATFVDGVMRWFFLLILFSMTGCSNPYEEFYTPWQPNMPNGRLLLTNEEPELIQVSAENYGKYLDRLAENGYILIGVSSFNGADTNDGLLKKFATKIKASKAVFYKEHTDTVSGSIPMTSSSPETTYYSGSSSYGSFSGVSTTYKNTTVQVPYSIPKYDYEVAYIVQVKHGGLGVFVRDLNVNEKQTLESNLGIYVSLVRKNSSAFRGNIIQGDIITKIDNTEIIDSVHFSKAITKKYGKKSVRFTIFRKGEFRNISLDIDP
jgi:PDZ domain-containing protein